MNDEELLSASEAADYLGITRARIHAIRKSREEAGQKFGKELGKYWYFTRAELDAYNENKQRPNPSKDTTAMPTPVMAV